MNKPLRDIDTYTVDNTVLEQAAQWLARLWADDVSSQDHRACEHWRANHPAHEQAWQSIMQVQAKFNALPANAVSSHVLQNNKSSSSRRNFLQLASVVGIASVVAYYGVNNQHGWRGALAAYSTDVGEKRTIKLEDGTQIILNTNTAFDINFTAKQRHMVLYRGEALITTGHESPRRRFTVATEFGELTALGTHFNVRQHNSHVQLAVFEGAVQVAPSQSMQNLILNPGEQVTFNKTRVAQTTPATVQANAWSKGVLVAERMPVGEVISELARYRQGILGCDPQIAKLQVSGVFSVTDTDRALQSLVSSLPVALVYRSRYWVRVVAV